MEIWKLSSCLPSSEQRPNPQTFKTLREFIHFSVVHSSFSHIVLPKHLYFCNTGRDTYNQWPLKIHCNQFARTRFPCVCVCVCVTVIHLPLTKSFVPQTQLEPNCTIPVAVLGKQRACPASQCREGCEVPAWAAVCAPSSVNATHHN